MQLDQRQFKDTRAFKTAQGTPAFKTAQVSIGGSRAQKVPKESSYEAELVHALRDCLEPEVKITAQYHIIGEKKIHRYSDIVVVPPPTSGGGPRTGLAMEPMELNGCANGAQKTSIHWLYSELHWLHSQLHWAPLSSIANPALELAAMLGRELSKKYYKTLEYAKLLSSNEVWVVHFMC
ncbi:hypothetical protein F8M41_005767 [Gigaspora margarita]|uniref:Uncharacterized protein n=1 Tax=Gigaspora margarita TaxID=4874 RepID=A0A8H3X9J2_GIGMA|nr:hypothetical protein F8M41_005767 [Gigaspora margarita]